jgi:hypothetical protein
MSQQHPYFANGHAANRRPHTGGTVDWTGYPALFQRIAPGAEPAARRPQTVEIPAEPTTSVRPANGVCEAFLGFCQAALFPFEMTYRAEPFAAASAIAAAEAFGFTREEIRRLGCGLYAGPAAVREDLRDVGFGDDEIDAARLVCDDSGRPRSELAGCLVVPLTDETGRLCDFLFLSMAESGRGFGGYRFLYGPAKSGIVAYGLQVALSRPAGRHSLVLVDDILECLLLQCRGLHHVAAVGGPGQELTPRRWEELARLRVTSATLAFRRDERHAASVRDALVGALRARTAPEIYAVNPYPGGERCAADVLRRFGKDTCGIALESRSLAFHDKDFGAAPRTRPVVDAVPARPAPVPVPQPEPKPLPAEPHHRAAFRKHLAELAAGLPGHERAVAEEMIAAVGLAITLGDYARAVWLIDGGAFQPIPVPGGWFWSTWAGGYASPRHYGPAVAPGPAVPTAWPNAWSAPVWPTVPAPAYLPLSQTEGGRAVLAGLRDWLRREREAAAA